MSSKSKSSLTDHSNNKASPATPKVASKLSRGAPKSNADSASPLQNPRLSVDRSPRSLNSKPTVDRRSPKLATPPDKQLTRVSRGSELQAQLSLVQEDLTKANEKLVLVEKEKAQAIEELKEAQRSADEANEKLGEAQVAQKRAEKNSEIEKFRAVEMEQVAIESTQKKEEEWRKEIEALRNHHATDVAALLSATEELQRVKQELAMNLDAKNQALSHADDISKIAEVHAQKVESLSAELTRLKTSLDSKLENEADESTQLVSQLNLEIKTLKRELEKVKEYEQSLVEKEACVEQLNVELEAAKLAESYARNLMEEWQKKVKDLKARSEESNRLERSASESLESVMKQLEESNDLLHDAKSEVDSLKEKVGLMEISISRQRGELEESERRLITAKEKAAEMTKKAESLSSELENVKEEKNQALNNEKLAAESVQTLLEEKNKLIDDLESSRDEEEKSKKAMESLAAALHEVSLEARAAKEKLLSSQAEQENYENQIEDLRLVLKATNEKYKTMLDDAKHEIDILTDTIEQNKHDYQNSRSEWEQKEAHLMKCVKQSEDECSSIGKEKSRLVNVLKEAEEEAGALKEERAQLKITLAEAESEGVYLKEIIGEAKAESMRLKESLLDKENELQSIIEENEELRTREATSIEKMEELTKLLEEATIQKQAEENGELSESEKDYDMLPMEVEFSEQNGHCREEEKQKVELPPEQCELPIEENHKLGSDDSFDEDGYVDKSEVENLNGNQKGYENKEQEGTGEKVLSPTGEQEQECLDDDLDSKVDGSEGNDQINGFTSAENLDGGTSPSKQYQKKKKPFLRKFGSLLKKKGTTNQK